MSDIVTIAGIQYRVFVDESGARTYKMVGAPTTNMARRLEKPRVPKGKSKRKSGG